ncbi:inhibitor of nuclear factor kappa-B kinase subunit epsilon isoform X1 [Arapaima gigas]
MTRRRKSDVHHCRPGQPSLVASEMLESTANYLWSVEDILGQGATASVYKARSKKTGELVAVKVFNKLSYSRPYEVQIREFDMLRKLNHVNIVKLFTVEEMHLTSKKVLVMEFCSGGSLLSQLEEPENAFGLPESEFLVVLQCVVHGMNHLRENGVVHRDIKPGNIMRVVGEDGRSIYKLTDFGAARELEDDEKFVSIYGTEEYLHPDMYERAVLKKPQQKAYGVTVDLWSIGVTFYHAATGSLPFVPFGGPRRNKRVMYKITTEKPVGAIAGVQNVEDGPIDWSYQMPSHCQLSEGLKAQLVPVLASILEANQDKCWGFDQFFAETTGILYRMAIHVFSLQQGTMHRIYIHFYNTASIFFEEVERQTQVSREFQQYFFLGHSLMLEPSMKVVNFPPTTPDRPIFLVSRRPEKTVGLLHKEPESPTMPTRFDILADYSFSKAVLGVIHQYLRTARALQRCQELILQGFYCYFENVRKECDSVVHKINILNMNLSSCLHMEDKLGVLSQSPLEVPELVDNRRKLKLIQDNLVVYINSIREFQAKLDHLHMELSKRMEILTEDKSTQKMEVLLEKITAVHCQYRKDKASGSEINLSNNIKKVKSLFRDSCIQKYHEVLSLAASWTSETHEIQAHLKEFTAFFLELMKNLEMCERRHSKVLDRVLLRLQHGPPLPRPMDSSNDKDDMVLRMNQLKDDMELVARELQHNNSIIERLGAMTMSPGV